MVKLWRYAALAVGLVCVGCEAWGVYDFLQQEQKGWNYIVVAGVVVAAGAGLLPLFAEQARAQGRGRLAITFWLALPLAMAFVLMAAIQRTGGAADFAFQERERAERNRELHERSEREATEALPIARQAAITECASGRGKRCLEAEGKVSAAEDRIAAARSALARATASHQEDPLARRIVRVAPFLTVDQVRLYQPLFLPFLMSLFGALFLAFGAHAGSAPKQPERAGEDDSTRDFIKKLAWDAGVPERIDVGDGQYILKSELRKAVADGKL